MKLIHFKNVHLQLVVKLSLSQYKTIIMVQCLILIYKTLYSCQFSMKFTKMFITIIFLVSIRVTYRKQIAVLSSMIHVI